MCGIAGIYHYASGKTIVRAQLEAMRDTMVHRGPDGSGLWVSPNNRIGFAHRRLSIIDLSDSAAQPMCNEDQRIWITFNGEIYNHMRLRDELIAAGHLFRTDHSDTEVLIHGYEEWGLDGLLKRISGDYAFALWDDSRETLSLARDRIGVKPLYFAVLQGALVFASEIKALLKYPEIRADIEPAAMYHYLSFLTTPAPLTMFKGIFKVPAGFYLEMNDKGNFRGMRYWDAVPGNGISPEEIQRMSDADKEKFYVHGIQERLTGAIEKRMMSDVPFGVFLSGGIDSSTNVALMSQRMSRQVDTFTVGFKDYQHLNELSHADRVAKEFKTNHHEILIDKEDMIGYLGDLVHQQDEPIADWVCIPLFFVSKLAKDSGVTVIQVGEGSDEQFCGYASYMAYLHLYRRYWRPFQTYLPKFAQQGFAAMAKLAATARPSLAIYADIVDRAAREREHFWSGATVFWDMLKSKLVNSDALGISHAPSELVATGFLPETYMQPDSFNVIQSFLGPFDLAHPHADSLTRMIYNEFKLRLPELLLMRVDKITMSQSLEARVPFLDQDLVEFTMDIPEHWKTRNGEAKYLLKKAVKGLIPDAIIQRKKMGFGAPMSQWLRGNFGRDIEKAVTNSKLMKRGFFSEPYIRSLFRDHLENKRDNSLYIWTLFNLTAWFDYWVTA